MSLPAEVTDDPKVKEASKPLCIRLLKFFEGLNVVPVLFFKLAGDYAVYQIEEEMRLERFCRQSQNFSVEECDLIETGNYTNVKEAWQENEDYYTFLTYAISIPICFFVVAFAASWSDRHGRKFLLKASLLVYSITAFIYLLFVVFEDWPVQVMLVGVVLRSIVGGPALFTMASFSMMVDQTSLQMRTARLGLLTNKVILGIAVGHVGGLILRQYELDHFWILFLGLVYYSIAIFFATVTMKEDPANFENRLTSKHKNPYLDFFHPANVSDIFAVIQRKRERNGRLQLLMILLVAPLVMFSVPHLMKTWIMNDLDWSLKAYNTIAAATVISTQMTTIIVIRLTRNNPIHDCLLTAISEGMTTIQCLLLASVTQPALSSIVYAAALFAFSHNFTNVGLRAASSKLCDLEEVGKLFGIMALLEVIITLVNDVMFLKLFEATRETLSTSQHLLSASFGALNTFIMFAVFLSMKRNKPKADAMKVSTTDIEKKETGSQQTPLSNDN